jgi:hypothetical protein
LKGIPRKSTKHPAEVKLIAKTYHKGNILDEYVLTCQKFLGLFYPDFGKIIIE